MEVTNGQGGNCHQAATTFCPSSSSLIFIMPSDLHKGTFPVVTRK